MTIIRAILRFLAGIGMFEWGYHANYIQRSLDNYLISLCIGIAVWISFYVLLELSDE